MGEMTLNFLAQSLDAITFGDTVTRNLVFYFTYIYLDTSRTLRSAIILLLLPEIQEVKPSQWQSCSGVLVPFSEWWFKWKENQGPQ